MSNRIPCGGCGKVYPLWIAANAKQANCSECGTQIEQRQVQPQPLVPAVPIDTPVTSVSKNDIDFTMIFFNTAIIGTAFLLIISVIWIGTRMFDSETPTAAANPKPPAQAEPSAAAGPTITAASDIEDNADEERVAEQAAGEKTAAAVARTSGKGSVIDVFDEKEVAQCVGLVTAGMIHTDQNETKHKKFFWLPLSDEEMDERYSEKLKEYFADTYGSFIGKQLVPTSGTGTCFLITSDGFAVTNLHVVADYLQAKANRRVYKELEDVYDDNVSISPQLHVYLNGAHHTAGVVYSSTKYDLAILKIESISDSPYFRLTSTEHIPRLTKVTVLGYPASARESFTDEEVEKDRNADKSTDPRTWFKDADLVYVATRGEVSKVTPRGSQGVVVQHTAIIDGGNSGGPLVTDDGIVVGINTWKATRVVSGFVQGAGMNLSLSMHSVFDEIAEHNAGIDVQWVDSLPKPTK
jgi:S1-C subfamily serine protease